MSISLMIRNLTNSNNLGQFHRPYFNKKKYDFNNYNDLVGILA